MQISKSYSCNLGEQTATLRSASFGVTSSISMYPLSTDFLNQSIADFLHDECGVDAQYEVRAGSSDKFLWIYNAPFLFNPTMQGSYSVVKFYGPYSSAELQPGYNGTASKPTSTKAPLFSSPQNGVADYGIVFTGNPESGFMLRFKNTNGVWSSYCISFIKATNMLNGKNAVLYRYLLDAFSTTLASGMNGIDLNEDNTLDNSSWDINPVYYYPILPMKTINKTSGEGHFPLIPLIVGPWKATNLYLKPVGFGLPVPQTLGSELQQEFEISGRRFIDTVHENYSVQVACGNIGLIEVTE